MENQILSVISPTILVAVGIALIALEAILFSFIAFWFGLATLLVGISSYFFRYGDGLWQLVAISIISLVLLFTLRTKAMELFMKSKDHEHNDDFLNESGEGVIKDGRVYFKATYWKIDSDESFEEGEKVKILSTKGSVASVEKL